MQFLFPNEILQLILANLSTRDLFRLKLTNRQFRQVIKQIEIGQLSQVQLSFPNDPEKQFNHICKSTNYLLFNHYLHIFKDNKSRDFWLPFLNISCTSGDYHIPNYLIKKYQGNQKLNKSDCYNTSIVTDWNYTFANACEGGNIKLVKKLIKLGANYWNWGLNGACRGGHMEIVKFMIEKGANDWNWGLRGACFDGHIEIVKLMIEICCRHDGNNANNWNGGLYEACRNGHIEIVKLMISRGATHCRCNKPISEH